MIASGGIIPLMREQSSVCEDLHKKINSSHEYSSDSSPLMKEVSIVDKKMLSNLNGSIFSIFESV